MKIHDYGKIDMIDFSSLTLQHERILLYVGAGLLNKQIAAELGIGPKTVECHLKRIKRRLKYKTRGELILLLHGIDPTTVLEDARERAATMPKRPRICNARSARVEA